MEFLLLLSFFFGQISAACESMLLCQHTVSNVYTHTHTHIFGIIFHKNQLKDSNKILIALFTLLEKLESMAYFRITL